MEKNGMTILKDAVMTTLYAVSFSAITAGCILETITKYKELAAAGFEIRLWPSAVLVNFIAIIAAYLLLELLFQREYYDTTFRTIISGIITLVKKIVCNILFICGAGSFIAGIVHLVTA